MKMNLKILCFPLVLGLVGCDDLMHKEKDKAGNEQPVRSADHLSTDSDVKRFIFPTKSSPFLDSSIALDTVTGKLCKTYSWPDSVQLPKLPLCSDLSSPETAFVGAGKAYRGSSYSFNGKMWVKGAAALRYNEKTGNMDPNNEDQYDPLSLLSKDDKSKMKLRAEQIRAIANQFGVTYEEAWNDAKAQGYQVPPKN